MTDKINLYINSSYRKKDETTSYLKCIVPSGLIKSYGKDYLTLSVTSSSSSIMINEIKNLYNGLPVIKSILLATTGDSI